MEIKIMFIHFSRIKAKMKTVRQIMIEGEDIEIGSDSDVSDTSQISIHSVLGSDMTLNISNINKTSIFFCQNM